jgi:hypothetical protein
MFVEANYRQSPDYRLFWEKLGRVEYDAGRYKRVQAALTLAVTHLEGKEF